jgi:hypothetical protein
MFDATHTATMMIALQLGTATLATLIFEVML